MDPTRLPRPTRPSHATASVRRRILAATPAAALLLLAAGLSPARPAHAETVHTCDGFIDSLPATITTQGTWCLRKNLSTSIASGAAITIAANNVVLDCNGYKIGGLAAGTSSKAVGVDVPQKDYATVRNCSIRGFYAGIQSIAGNGHLITDNRIDNSLFAGIHASSWDSVITRNRVVHTGGAKDYGTAVGILGGGTIAENRIFGIFSSTPSGMLVGIMAQEHFSSVRDNDIGGFYPAGEVNSYGIRVIADHVRVSGNHLGGHEALVGSGIYSVGVSLCLLNTVSGFSTPVSPNCLQTGNLAYTP